MVVCVKNKITFNRGMSDQINTVNAWIYTAVKSDTKLHLARVPQALLRCTNQSGMTGSLRKGQ